MGLIQVDCNKLFHGDSFIESLRFNNLPCKEVKILSDNIQEELDLLAECSVRTPEHTHSSEQRLFLSYVFLKCRILFQESGVPTSSLSQLLCRCILKDSQKYFTTKLNPSDVSVFWIRVHGRKTHFYTVVYVNNVHITGPPAHLRWSTPTKEKTSSFAKRKTFFLMYISLCFYTKRAKK